MLRAFYIFLVIAALSAIGIWLADNPGQLVMHWRGYEIRTSFVVGIALLAVVAFLALFIYRLFVSAMGSPAELTRYFQERRRKKGFLALSRGMVAVAAGDAGDAKRFAKDARELLDAPSLTLLLSAQAAQLEGDDQAAAGYFRQMIATPETEFLGLRGLFIQAKRAGDRDEALKIAKRAFKLRPNTPWAAQAVFEIETAEENWKAALDVLDAELASKLIDREKARRRRAVLLTAQAQEAEVAARMQPGDAGRKAFDRAFRLASEALSLAPYFPPAMALAVRVAAATGRTRKAMKLVQDGWAHEPHPDLASAWLEMVEGESAYDRLTRAYELEKLAPDHTESRILVARAAIGARDWQAARKALAPFTGPGAEEAPTRRVCELMAEIEEGEFGNRGSSRGWLSRALHAPDDPQWVGDAYRSHRWSPINPVTGEFDALSWAMPAIRLPASGMPGGAEGVPEDRHESVVTETVEPEPFAAPGDDARDVTEKLRSPVAQPAPATAGTAEKSGPENARAPTSDSPVKASPVEDDTKAEEDLVIVPPVPDDPGPDGDEDEAREGSTKW